jgi:uncharacterized membrane protein YozB (DUF420 family)
MFIPCFIKRSRKNQHNAQICTTALFIVLCHFLTLVRPGVLRNSICFSTQGTSHTDYYLLYVLDKPPYRSVFFT